MTNALKGALLSGLVLPGLGQVALKKYTRGMVLILAVLISFAVMVVTAAQLAFAILARIESEGGALDMQTLVKTAAQASSSSDSRTFNFCLFTIFVCWVIGIGDAYLIGMKQDQHASKSSSTT